MKNFLKVTLATTALSLTSLHSVADVDPWVVAADIPGLIGDLWPNGKRSSKGISFSGPVAGANQAGSFNVVTFNVDGFPKSIGGASNSDTKTLFKIMEQQDYDMVFMQELFTSDKHNKLRDQLSDQSYPYRSYHHRGSRTSFGSGLVRLSDFPFDRDSGFDREDWSDCFDIDCYTEKGFTFQRHYVDEGFVLDVYNIHTDAGGQEGDIKAKRKGMEQLASYINKHSAGNAVIVAGDYNLSWSDDSKSKSAEFYEINVNFLNATGLQYVCQATHGGSYENSLDGCKYHFSKPDRIAFKSGGGYILTPTHLEYVQGVFVKDNGNEISDHYPLKAQFSWQQAQ